MITDYKWIDDNSELEQLILSLNNTDAVAFDSEFERVNTYYPKPALFQLKINNKYFLIDMKKISNHQVFKTLLNNIILHSGSEDLEILHNFNKILPSQVFDTQIAASLCGYGLHFSYQNIVKELLNVELSKAHSRSDWMRRPLSSDQIQYALDDVVYLDELKNILTTKLVELNRIEWFEALTKIRLDSIINNNHVEKTFVKIAKAKRLDLPQQQLLFVLLNWREKIAIQRDKPRQWILKNDDIVNIIYQRPSHAQQLISDIGLYPKFVKVNADSIFELYKTALELSKDDLPKIHKLNARQGEKHAKEKEKLKKVCEILGLPPALIINVADLKSLVASGKDLSDLKMWQLINE
ncbi:MAG: ribonuclease D [Marinicellaceae bacterium]